MPADGDAAREKRLAVFIDFENLAIGIKKNAAKTFDIVRVFDRLLEKGKILVKKAYADWSRYREYKQQFHEAAIELVEIPMKRIGGKNSADIRLVCDALELVYTKEHLDTFVLVSGDSDFSPLVSRLREADREVIGIGLKAASSPLLIENCDEFIYYEDLEREREAEKSLDVPPATGVSKKGQEAFALVVDAVRGLIRENRELIWASMVKQTIKRKRPSFDESYHGFGSFSELLLEAERLGILRLEKDPKSGSLIVTGLGKKRTR